MSATSALALIRLNALAQCVASGCVRAQHGFQAWLLARYGTLYCLSVGGLRHRQGLHRHVRLRPGHRLLLGRHLRTVLQGGLRLPQLRLPERLCRDGAGGLQGGEGGGYYWYLWSAQAESGNLIGPNCLTLLIGYLNKELLQ